MGLKLEVLKKRAKDTAQMNQKAIQEAKEVAEEISDTKERITEIPEGVDEDILKCGEEVRSGAIKEATVEMNDNIHEKIETAADKSTEIISETQEQEAMSEQAGEKFSEIKNFGKETASEAQSKAETFAANFAEIGEQEQQKLEESESRFQELLAEIEDE